tara:strand:+ start:478 stop:1143 length:666 start_codon:yes stop_codon:yes gene_type:complete
MNEIYNKYENLNQLVKRYHNDSLYASKPLPKLIAVSKKQPDEKILSALKIGQRIFGENKLQEALKRWKDLINLCKDIELHCIGHLQSNKVKKALKFFDVIHTLDRESLALEISKQLTSKSKTKKFLIQVNTGNEKNKSGVSLDDFEEFFKFVNSLNIPVHGLMCLPPVEEDPSIHFCMLRELANKFKLRDLSMGMSTDFEKAINFGATYLRIGSAFFGKRD